MTHTTRPHAVIIGCGIGGPVAALALQRAGIDATIYEAYDRPADFVGSFLNLASNGIDALRTIGIDRPVLDAAFPTPRMVMWSGSGKRLGEVANGLPLADGVGSQTIQRGHLHRILREEAVRRGIAILPGKRLAGINPAPDGVVAAFEDKTEVHAPILIGADGIQSRVRTAIDPAAPSPRDKGFLSLGGRAAGTALTPTPDAFHMMFGRRAFFAYSVRPNGEVYWFANVAAADAISRDTRKALLAAAWKDRLREIFAADAGPALEILRATGDEVAAYPVFDLPVVPVWHRDAMVLLGDAAHATSPSSGQGASLAIEDAIVLARCLRDARHLAQAFATYESLRRKRAERVVAYASRIDHSKTPGPVGRWVRDLVMPLALRVFARPESQAWLFRYHIDWNEPRKLVA